MGMMECVALRHRNRQNEAIEDCFWLLADGLDEIQTRLTHNARFALRDAKDAARKSGADGIRACGERLLKEIEPCPLKTAKVSTNAKKLSELLFT